VAVCRIQTRIPRASTPVRLCLSIHGSSAEALSLLVSLTPPLTSPRLDSPLPVRAKPVVLLSCIVPLFLPLVLACSAFRACFCRTPIPDLATPSGTRASRFIAHRWIPSFSHVARIHTPECIPLPLLFRLPAQGHTEQTYDQQPPTSRNLWPPTRTSLLPLRRRRRRSAPIQGSQCDLFTSNYSLYQYSHLWCRDFSHRSTPFDARCLSAAFGQLSPAFASPYRHVC
jgi:hypothetical protein